MTPPYLLFKYVTLTCPQLRPGKVSSTAEGSPHLEYPMISFPRLPVWQIRAFSTWGKLLFIYPFFLLLGKFSVSLLFYWDLKTKVCGQSMYNQKEDSLSFCFDGVSGYI